MVSKSRQTNQGAATNRKAKISDQSQIQQETQDSTLKDGKPEKEDGREVWEESGLI